VRNAFGDLGVLYHEGNRINRRYIQELHNIQSSTALHLANKIRGTHLDYTRTKIKVSLATQTLGSSVASVASAIDFLRDLGLPVFAASEATCKFIRIFDELFDIYNSSSFCAKGFKSPLTCARLFRSYLLACEMHQADLCGNACQLAAAVICDILECQIPSVPESYMGFKTQVSSIIVQGSNLPFLNMNERYVPFPIYCHSSTFVILLYFTGNESTVSLFGHCCVVKYVL